MICLRLSVVQMEYIYDCIHKCNHTHTHTHTYICMGVLSIDYRKSLGSYGVYRHFQQYFCYIDIRGGEFEDIKVVIRIRK